MEPLALALVLLGSLIHVGWNALAKDAVDRLAFLWLALAPLSVAGAGLLAWAIARGELGWETAPYIAATGGLHAVYFGLLAAAYDHADLSFVYPYSRGVGAALATLGGVALLGEDPTALGWLGIALAGAATFVEAGARAAGAPQRTSTRGALLTGATACAIGGYLVVDTVGVRTTTAMVYLAGLYVVTVACLAPLVLRGGRAAREWRRAPWRPAIAGAFVACGYGVVLYAMARAPVSYVVAARASGIAASAVAGMWLFSERLTLGRWIAIALIAAGVVCIGLA